MASFANARRLCYDLRICAALAVLTCTISAIEPEATQQTNRTFTVSEWLEQDAKQRQRDVAEAAMVCARDLPGLEQCDLDQSLRTVAAWAETVRREMEVADSESRTKARLAGESENQGKIETMLRVVRETLKVRYNPEPVPGGSLQAAVVGGLVFDARDLFSVGIVAGRPGTAASLPFLYLALGRRLGYPLKVAVVDERVVLRWMDGKEQFNIDWQDANLPPQEYQEPVGQIAQPPADGEAPPAKPAPREHVLSGDEELSLLLNARGACLESHGKDLEALVAYAQANLLAPAIINHRVAIAHVLPKITPLFGHTSARPAPDYSQRGDLMKKLARNKDHWDELERAAAGKIRAARTADEKYEQVRQRSELMWLRIESQNAIMMENDLRSSERQSGAFGIP